MTRLESWIGLTAKLSRAFATHSILVIVLMIMILLTMLQTLESKVAETEFRVKASCHSLEVAATTLASTPHYSIASTNAAIESSIRGTVHQLSKVLTMTIKLLNQLLLFLLFRYKRLLLCILDSILAGTVNTLATYSREIATFLDQQLRSISDALNTGLDGINQQIRSIGNAANTAANTVGGLFGTRPANGNGAPTAALPEVRARLDFKLPDDFQAKLSGIKVPTLDDAEKALGDIISRPFRDLSTSLNASMSRLSFAQGVQLPVPAKAADVEFCDSIPTGWIPSMIEALRVGFWLSIWILLLVGIVIMIWNGVMIYVQHTAYQKRLAYFRDIFNCQYLALSNMDSGDAIKDLVKSAERPYFWSWSNRLSSRFKLRNSQVRLSWLLDYTLYPPFLLYLIMGLLGLLLVQVQFLLINQVKTAVLQDVAQEVQLTSQRVMGAVQKSVDDVVNPYVSTVNQRIGAIEKEANDVLFGWVNTTADALNTTSNTLNRGFNEAMAPVFDAVPPLKTTLNNFLNCLVGSTLTSLIEITTILREGAQIEFPRVNTSVASLNAGSFSDASALASKMSIKLSGDSSNTTSSKERSPEYIFEREMDRLLNFYKSILKIQQKAFLVLTAFGGFGIALGITTVLIDSLAQM